MLLIAYAPQNKNIVSILMMFYKNTEEKACGTFNSKNPIDEKFPNLSIKIM